MLFQIVGGHAQRKIVAIELKKKVLLVSGRRRKPHLDRAVNAKQKLRACAGGHDRRAAHQAAAR